MKKREREAKADSYINKHRKDKAKTKAKRLKKRQHNATVDRRLKTADCRL